MRHKVANAVIALANYFNCLVFGRVLKGALIELRQWCKLANVLMIALDYLLPIVVDHLNLS